MAEIRSWAARSAGQRLEPFVYEPGPLGDEEVEIAVEYCGLCHSDLSIINNDWGITRYPVVPGHEVIGKVVATGADAKGVEVGQRVGIGWNAGCCMHCRECLSGNHHLCSKTEATRIGHYGGFAERVRAHWIWTFGLPEKLDPSSAGPLLCGGITVFAPLVTYGVKPTDRVGIVGIGGLGHMALQFLKAWGCEVTAFTSSLSKSDQLRKLGAHRVVSSQNSLEIAKAANSLDFLLVTVNILLDWSAYLRTLKPGGRMHVVGAVLEPMPIRAFDLISGQKSVQGLLREGLPQSRKCSILLAGITSLPKLNTSRSAKSTMRSGICLKERHAIVSCLTQTLVENSEWPYLLFVTPFIHCIFNPFIVFIPSVCFRTEARPGSE